MFSYKPNPAHKTYTTCEGPPRWNPHKEKCPDEENDKLSHEECEDILRESLPKGLDPNSNSRFAMRRKNGIIEFYALRRTEIRPNGAQVFHGFPITPASIRICPAVARKWNENGLITKAEYKGIVNTKIQC